MRPGNASFVHHTHRAFSLIELVAVVVIAGIMGAVSIASMGSLSSTRVAASARAIRRDLEFTRARAKNLSLIHWVSFSTGGGSYTIYEESRTTPGRTNATVLADPLTGKNFTRTVSSNGHDGVTLYTVSINSGTWLGFDIDGSPLDSSAADLATDGTVVVRSSAGTNKTITITAYTGAIQGP